MEMQRRVGPIIYSSPCDNLSVLVVKDANHENFACNALVKRGTLERSVVV